MKRIFITSLALLAIFTSCENQEVEQNTSVADCEMKFNVIAPGAKTKVTGNAFDKNDKVGLYVTDYLNDNTPLPLQISGNRVNNAMLESRENEDYWSAEKPVYWVTGYSDVYAYYPYNSDISDINNQYFEVATDQTTPRNGEMMSGYEASDFLWAKAEKVGKQNSDKVAVALPMKHVLSKFTVRIIAGEKYVGSLPSDATVTLHNTVTAARIDLQTGSVEKDPYAGPKSIEMKKVGLGDYKEAKAVVYEAIVVPQMLESLVPFIEINTNGVSYMLEDTFNFRPGTAYSYNVTLNTSTTAIKVEIGAEIEDWGGEGEGGESGGESGGEEDDATVYTDLSTAGTANCYLVSEEGNYMFQAVQGNSEVSVGNVKSVEVLWESFGTTTMPNVGDLISSVSYKDGYVRFSTPADFNEGNAVIAVKNSKGVILWSWHIWLAKEGWNEQVYYNNAGTMMDRNLGATSATPGNVGALGLLYQWGRKDPFLGSASTKSNVEPASTGEWSVSSESITKDLQEENPNIFYTGYGAPVTWLKDKKTIYDPCPAGWRVPYGGPDGVWSVATKMDYTDRDYIPCDFFDSTNNGMNFKHVFGDDDIWYPASGYRSPYSSGMLNEVGGFIYVYSVDLKSGSTGPYRLWAYGDYIYPASWGSTTDAYSVRCMKQ